MRGIARFTSIAGSIALSNRCSKNESREDKHLITTATPQDSQCKPLEHDIRKTSQKKELIANKKKLQQHDIHQIKWITSQIDKSHEFLNLNKDLDIHSIVEKETREKENDLNSSIARLLEQNSNCKDYDVINISDKKNTINALWETITHDDLNNEAKLIIQDIKLMLDKQEYALNELFQPIVLPADISNTVEYTDHSVFFLHSFKQLIKDKSLIDRTLQQLKRSDRATFIKDCEHIFDTHDDIPSTVYINNHVYLCIQALKSLGKDAVIDKTTSEIISRFGYDKMPGSNEEAIARFMEAMLERYKCEVILRKYALDSSKKKR